MPWSRERPRGIGAATATALVNNAGIGSAGAAEESSIGQAHHLFDVNVFGAMRMMNAALPHMRRWVA